ncbi:MAG: translation initiation factor IF-3 [Anaerolineae bacterium]|nr:translation initiation factor IF-3 [Anaerolineae bacterium]
MLHCKAKIGSSFVREEDREDRAISAGDYRINDRIRAREVRLITDTNENVGVVSIQQALSMAAERDLDLVEVAPNANPPVCKIMDFGKFLYERAKKDREARKQQKQIEVKEIRLRPKTDDHHRQFKVRDARRWLSDGMKVKVRIRFRGREITYPEIARTMLREVAEELQDVAIVEQMPNMEGRTMLMVLAPAPDKKQ